MSFDRSPRRDGALSDDDLALKVWAKGYPIPGWDSAVWRWSLEGKPLKFADKGEETEFGWDVGHIVARALGGADHVDNYRPQQWEDNRREGAMIGILAQIRRRQRSDAQFRATLEAIVARGTPFGFAPAANALTGQPALAPLPSNALALFGGLATGMDRY